MRKEKDDSLNEIYLLHFLGFEQQRRMLPVLSRTGVRARVERRSAPWRAVRIDAVARPSVASASVRVTVHRAGEKKKRQQQPAKCALASPQGVALPEVPVSI